MDEPFSLRSGRPPVRRKGEMTRESILNDAVALASQVGLEGLSIGALAARSGMSKSGLFAHFGSKEELQRATLGRAESLFLERVLQPAMSLPRGVPRLRALFDGWLSWLEGCEELPGGCLLISAASEYDDRPGPIRDALAAGQRELRGAIAKAVRQAIEAGALDPDVDPWQFTFELLGIVLAAYHERRLLNNRQAAERARRSFERLLSGSLTHRPAPDARFDGSQAA
jgi:AcrR family transcriptional regulator